MMPYTVSTHAQVRTHTTVRSNIDLRIIFKALALQWKIN